jgi:hypothetical protein
LFWMCQLGQQQELKEEWVEESSQTLASVPPAET